MKLRRIKLYGYRQFVEQRVDLDPGVTVIVGRNDTGKTTFIDRFFEQCVYGVSFGSGDRPNVLGDTRTRLHYSLEWEISAADYDRFPLVEAFRSTNVNSLEIEFDETYNPRYWKYKTNSQPVDVYEERGEHGVPVLREAFRRDRLLPGLYRINLPDHRILKLMFEARFCEAPKETLASDRRGRPENTEMLLLRLGGLLAGTRNVVGTDTPWQERFFYPRATLSLEEIEQRLSVISERVTTKLKQWWHNPSDLSFHARLTGGSEGRQRQHKLNTYIIVCEIKDESHKQYRGTGILWFTTLLIELMFLEDQDIEVLVVMDEPASPLHPSAQRSVAKLLGDLGRRRQLIYTTHSPFMIDWNFPQRLRIFHTEPATRKTRIVNKPYHPNNQFEHIWDPLRSSIGVSLGDVAVFGEHNLLVEGITDQILLANISAYLESRERTHVNLLETSIIPYGKEVALQQIVETIYARGFKVIVLADSDTQGEKVRKWCQKEQVPCVQMNTFAERVTSDASIEDLVGIKEYVSFVNAFYNAFNWFEPIVAQFVEQNIGELSLGKYLTEYFSERFERDFSKIGVAIFIADNVSTLSNETLDRFTVLIERFVTTFGNLPK